MNYNILLLIISTFLIVSYCAHCTARIGQTSFDLTGLTTQIQSPYVYWDIREVSQRTINYSYVFNFCNDVHPPLAICDTTNIDTPFGFEHRNGTALAFQIDYSRRSCRRLGNSTNFPGAIKYTLLDAEDSSKGITLVYTRGDQMCIHNVSATNCTDIRDYIFEIRLACRTDYIISTGNVISYITSNTIAIDIKSVFGCPLECGNRDIGVCDNHGKCGWDYDNFYPKCFCNQDYTGQFCGEKKKKKSNAGLYVAIVFSCILLVTVVGTIVYIYIKIKKVHDNYREPEEVRRFNEMGTQ